MHRKRNKFCLFILIFIVLITFGTEGYSQWIEKNSPGLNQPSSDYPENLAKGLNYTIGNSAYVGFGVQFRDIYGNVYTNDVYTYDLATSQWHLSAQLYWIPARAFMISFTHNGKGYFGLGRDDNSSYDDFWEIDLNGNALTQKASIQGARHNAIGFVSGSKAYVGGGYVNQLRQKDFYSYNFVTNSWQSENPLPADIMANPGVVNWTSMSIDGNGYLIIHRDSLNNLVNSFSRYDTLTHSWIQCSPYPGISESGIVAFDFNDQGFVGFGKDRQFHPLTEFYQYDVLNDNWIQKNSYNGIPPLSYSFSNGVKAGVIVGKGQVLEYDIVNDTWIEKVPKPMSVGGKIIVLNNKAYASSYVYDVASDSWIEDTSINVKWLFEIGNNGYCLRNNVFSKFDPLTHSFTPLSSPGLDIYFKIGNKGYNGHFNTDTTFGFWEFDPVTAQWTRKADFPGPRRECNGGFSIGNKGYITGGWCDSIGWWINNFWEYDPASDTWTQRADGPTGNTGCIMEGDATRGYVGLGNDAGGTGAEVGWISSYNPFSDAWTLLPPFGPRHNCYSFIANDQLYVGGGITRFSQLDSYSHSDLWLLPLSGINKTTEIGTSRFEVYPNPSYGKFNIKKAKGQKITIYDYSGKNIYSEEISSDEKQIDLTGIKSGVYFIQSDSRSQSIISKIIIL
jgi:N-acetylneuraminic acid mutarotase